MKLWTVLIVLIGSAAMTNALVMDEHTEKYCSDGVCKLVQTFHKRFYNEHNNWDRINESFDTSNCKRGYKYCVDKNTMQFQIDTEMNREPEIIYQKNNFTTMLSDFGGGMFTFDYSRINVYHNNISFDNILLNKNIDLEYIYHSDGYVKETLILNERVKIWEKDMPIKFRVKGKHFREENGSIVYSNGSHDIFTLLPLHVYDANEDFITAITYSLSDNMVNAVIPKKVFVNYEYPLYIDPLITMSVVPILSDGFVRNETPATPQYTRDTASTYMQTGRTRSGFPNGHIFDRGFFVANTSILQSGDVVFDINFTGFVTTVRGSHIDFMEVVGNDSDFSDDDTGNNFFYQELGNGTMWEHVERLSMNKSWWNYFNLSNASSSMTMNIGNGSYAVGTKGVESVSVNKNRRTRIKSVNDANESRRPQFTISYTSPAEEAVTEWETSIVLGILLTIFTIALMFSPVGGHDETEKD